MWTDISRKRLCFCYREEVGRIVIIIMDTLLIIRIGKTLLTRVGSIVAESTWRNYGCFSGGAVVIREVVSIGGTHYCWIGLVGD